MIKWNGCGRLKILSQFLRGETQKKTRTTSVRIAGLWAEPSSQNVSMKLTIWNVIFMVRVCENY
jgi:hypothetical protein